MPVLLRAADHKTMPWKNGAGVTIEIAVFPPGADLSSFSWRVSMATVAADGPFSVFPGIDRTLSILEGNGMVLRIEGLPEAVLTRGAAPLAFPADAATSAALIDGPIVDLNVMTRRGHWSHRVARIVVDREMVLGTSDGRTMVLTTGHVAAELQERTIELMPFDAVMLDGETLMLRPAEPCVIYAIVLNEAKGRAFS